MSTSPDIRKLPNILITGTPGTGKSTLCQVLAQKLPKFRTFNISELVKEKQLYESWDDKYQCYIIDEDKVVDYLEDQFSEQPDGNIVDYHSCDFFPERYFDLVIVLRTDNTILYKRLEKRGYDRKKISENVECEIFQVLLDEARSAYDEKIVVELQNNTIQQMEQNVQQILQWISNFKK